MSLRRVHRRQDGRCLVNKLTHAEAVSRGRLGGLGGLGKPKAVDPIQAHERAVKAARIRWGREKTGNAEDTNAGGEAHGNR